MLAPNFKTGLGFPHQTLGILRKLVNSFTIQKTPSAALELQTLHIDFSSARGNPQYSEAELQSL